MSTVGAVAPIAIRYPLEPEDQARADIYALFARLYAGGPDRTLLDAIAATPRLPDADLPFARAYNRLADASAVMDAQAARQEHFDIFVSVGKSEVNLHASHWLTGFMMEKPLAELRTELAGMGLVRRSDTNMVEDHLAALCETMRMLIEGDGTKRPAPLAAQREFFETHLGNWVFACCDAITTCSLANYYRCVAECTHTYMEIERDSLSMD